LLAIRKIKTLPSISLSLAAAVVAHALMFVVAAVVVLEDICVLFLVKLRGRLQLQILV
jgi:hypothetical protein